MADETVLRDDADQPAAGYDGSRLSFRGPRHPLGGRHVVFLGGCATHGGPLEAPFPALLEAELGEACVNFGIAQASAEAFLLDPVVERACREVLVTVVEVMGAANLSNRLYTVHPRRNDRFLRPSAALRAIYPDVDFAEICFTRHLLLALHEADAERFDVVREELRIAWAARMGALLERTGPQVLLLWPQAREAGEGPLGADPVFVTRDMVEELRPLVGGIVEVPHPGRDAVAHRSIAAALSGPLRVLLGGEVLRASA